MCNASDSGGRYAYAKQPEVCRWNLQKLAEALEPELPLELAEASLAEDFDAEFHRHYLQKMRRKLGLVHVEEEGDDKLVAGLLETMHLTGERAQLLPPPACNYAQYLVGVPTRFYTFCLLPWAFVCLGPHSAVLRGTCVVPGIKSRLAVSNALLSCLWSLCSALVTLSRTLFPGLLVQLHRVLGAFGEPSWSHCLWIAAVCLSFSLRLSRLS